MPTLAEIERALAETKHKFGAKTETDLAAIDVADKVEQALLNELDPPSQHAVTVGPHKPEPTEASVSRESPTRPPT